MNNVREKLSEAKYRKLFKEKLDREKKYFGITEV